MNAAAGATVVLLLLLPLLLLLLLANAAARMCLPQLLPLSSSILSLLRLAESADVLLAVPSLSGALRLVPLVLLGLSAVWYSAHRLHMRPATGWVPWALAAGQFERGPVR